MSAVDDEAAAEADPGYPDEDQEILDTIAARERAGRGYPDDDAIKAMEQTVGRLIGAATLMEDVLVLSSKPSFREEEVHLLGLVFLAGAMSREAERLYRLYHGMAPKYG